MKNLRLFALTSASLLSAAALLVAACSSDDTVVVADGGVADTGVDSNVDAKVDTGPTDGGADTGPAFDATLETFPNDIARVFCRTLARCCFGSPTPPDGGIDGGSFDVEKCETQYATGVDNSNKDVDKADASAVTFNKAKSDECLATLQGLACDVPAATYRALRAACFNSVVGKQPSGSSCATSVECAPGTFCKTNEDGTTNGATCATLRDVGGNCGDFNPDPLTGDEACSWRGSGDTNRYCNIYSDFATSTLAPREDWKCAASAANGGDCNVGTWCSAGVCDPNSYTCAANLNFFPPPLCANFVK